MMTAIAFRHAAAPQTLAERIWTKLSTFLTKLADADIRNGSAEPFGL